METAKQSYWKREHDIRSKVGADTSFIKREYHKVRRRYDEEVIQEQLRDRYASDNVLGWPDFDVDPTPLFCYREHNHKYTLGMTGFDGDLRFANC